SSDRRPGKAERRALTEGGLDPDAAAGALDHLLHDREADAGALDGHVVQPLEHLEDLLVVGGIDPDAVVPHPALDLVVAADGADLDPRLRRVPEILHGVAD